LLTERKEVRGILVVLVSGDRGLAGPYNTNMVRFVLGRFREQEDIVRYVVIGRRGRDMMLRRRKPIEAEFSDLPAEPAFADVSAIGRLVVEEYLEGRADRVFLAYTDFVNMLRQETTLKKLLPLELTKREEQVLEYGEERGAPPQAYLYEPGEQELIDRIVPRFTALQVYQAILESLASEHAARMVAMRNATENANELVEALRLQYNKARQRAITLEILDIVGGAEALAQAQQEVL
jgi:F-type H+-transporting ATPase subunit gamma